MDHRFVKRVLLGAFLFLGFHLSAWAGFALAVPGGGAVKSGGTYSVKGANATAANGAFVTPATVTAAGKQVTMPATAQLAANAASFALTAVRLNPAGLMLGLTAQWLITQGLSYANDQWTKTQSTAGAMYWLRSNSSVQFAAPGTLANLQIFYPGNGDFSCMACLGGWGSCTIYPKASVSSCISAANTSGAMTTRNGDNSIASYTLKCSFNGAAAVPGGCPAQSSTAPAVEADFTAAAASPLPLPAAEELARADVPIPIQDPVLDPAPKIVDYGSPYLDPVTNKTVQTKTRLTPEPTAADPYNVRVESYNVEVAPAPAPLPGEPVPVPASEQPKDPCLDNPDRVGCMNAGTPEDTDLQTQAVPFSVTPLSVGGAGACPPDAVIGVHGLSVTLKLAPICDAAGWLRPLVLALAWFSAALIVGGAVRES